MMSATHLEQVMSILITNSRQALPNGGLINVSTRNGPIPAARATGDRDASATELWLGMSLEDDGAGIPDSILSSIFEPSVSTKGESIGSGVGLATCSATFMASAARLT